MEELKKNLRLLEELDKHSTYVNAKVARGIEENRKGLFRIKIRNKDGSEAECTNVRARQVSHEFKFGAPLFVLGQLDDEEQNKLYEERFKEICNYAVVPIYWKDLEPERGKFRYDESSSFIWRRPPLDRIFDFCRKNNIRTKAHCLAYNSFNPDWIKDLTLRELNIAMEERMQSLAERYSKELEDLDVMNEMFNVYKNCYKGCGNGMRDLALVDDADYISKMFIKAKQYFPHSVLMWNEGVEETFGRRNYKGPRSTYYMMLREQLEKGVPVEGIGIQYHLFMTDGTDFENDAVLCNPLRLLDAIERYSDFRLPIQISEVSVPANADTAEAEALQAEIVKRLYPLFFSQKYMEGISWWNIADGMAYGDEGQHKAGLMHRDLSPKPAFKVISDLIHKEWCTDVTFDNFKTVAEFTGFYGEYEISFVNAGKEYTKKVRLHKENTGYNNKTLLPRETVIEI